MIDFGGGVNIPAGPRWGARVGFDYRRGFFKEEEGGAVDLSDSTSASWSISTS